MPSVWIFSFSKLSMFLSTQRPGASLTALWWPGLPLQNRRSPSSGGITLSVIKTVHVPSLFARSLAS